MSDRTRTILMEALQECGELTETLRTGPTEDLALRCIQLWCDLANNIDLAEVEASALRRALSDARQELEALKKITGITGRYQNRITSK